MSTRGADPADWPDLSLPGADADVLERLDRVVAAQPDALALVSPLTSLTYEELARAARHLATRLRERLGPAGGTPEPVAVLAEQGVETVVAMLAVVTAGAAVTVLDPMLPHDRVDQVLRLSGARLLLRGRQLSGPAADRPDGRGFPVPDLVIEVSPTGDRELAVRPATPAGGVTDPARPWEVVSGAAVSVMFTSGSTGLPKGVVYTHRTALSGANVGRSVIGIGRDDRMASVLPHSFALGQEIVWVGLLNGASLHVLDPRTAGARALRDWLVEQRVTVLHTTPSLLRALVAELAADEVLGDVRAVVTGGEAVQGRDLEGFRRHLSPAAHLFSQLGSSEAGVFALWRHSAAEPVPAGVVPVGSSVPLKEVVVVDAAGDACPTGVVGDVEVRSAWMSAGYWADPERTAARFRSLPDGRVALATGDRGRLDETGVLHLVGRRDDAVKIGGYLVEPAEVETALLALPGVAQAVVRGRVLPGAEGVQLVAWVVPAPGPSPSPAQLRRGLAGSLPSWMTPRAVVLLPRLPHTTGGKLDVAALPLPGRRPVPRDPATREEAAVGRIWADLLGLAQVDPDESFVELGGDSLVTEEMLVRLEEQLGVRLTMSDLAEHPTLRLFAARVADRLAGRPSGAARRLAPTTVRLAEGDGIPVFCFAGAATHGLSMSGLADGLGADGHPVHAFHVSGFAARGKLDWTLQANARRHLRELTRLAPEGPVVLIGHSLGGLVALEVARLLAEQGREVPLLVVLDSYLPPRHGGHVGGWGAREAGPVLEYASVVDVPPATERERRSTWRLLVRTLRVQDRETLRQRLMLPLAGVLRLPTATAERVFWQLGLFTARSARLTPWPGRTLLLYTDENPDDLVAWDDILTGEHELHRVDGDHAGILRPPYLAETLAHVRTAVRRATSGPAAPTDQVLSVS